MTSLDSFTRIYRNVEGRRVVSYTVELIKFTCNLFFNNRLVPYQDVHFYMCNLIRVHSKVVSQLSQQIITNFLIEISYETIQYLNCVMDHLVLKNSYL